MARMTHLPHRDRAILDLHKLEGYCLDPTHPRGRHKARVFREALGIGKTHAPWLRNVLLKGVDDNDASLLVSDTWGSRWRVDIPIARRGKRVVVRTIWIVGTGEISPRFVTCWVL